MSQQQLSAIQQRVIELAAEQGGVHPSQVARDTHFVNDLNFDSLDLVELTMALEDEFELSISDAEAQELQTVGQAVDFIVRHVNAQSARS